MIWPLLSRCHFSSHHCQPCKGDGGACIFWLERRQPGSCPFLYSSEALLLLLRDTASQPQARQSFTSGSGTMAEKPVPASTAAAAPQSQPIPSTPTAKVGTHLGQRWRNGREISACQHREALVLPPRPVVDLVGGQEVARPGVAPAAEGLRTGGGEAGGAIGSTACCRGTVL